MCHFNLLLSFFNRCPYDDTNVELPLLSHSAIKNISIQHSHIILCWLPNWICKFTYLSCVHIGLISIFLLVGANSISICPFSQFWHFIHYFYFSWMRFNILLSLANEMPTSYNAQINHSSIPRILSSPDVFTVTVCKTSPVKPFSYLKSALQRFT